MTRNKNHRETGRHDGVGSKRCGGAMMCLELAVDGER